jgi:hypothetical protein
MQAMDKHANFTRSVVEMDMSAVLLKPTRAGINCQPSPSRINKFSSSELQAMLEKDPMYWEQREDMLGVMAIAKGAAAAAEYLNEGIASKIEEIKSNFKRQAQAICNKNDLIHKRCRQIKNAPQTAVEVFGSFNTPLHAL